MTTRWLLGSPAEMRAWGRRFSRILKTGDIVALIGPLGAGKTTLVQGIAKGWGYQRGAVSPTFSLANEYRTPEGNVYHMDMYRLSERELSAFPLDDYLEGGLCLIEWADRIRHRFPAEVLEIHLRQRGVERRELRIVRPPSSWTRRL